jgi:hypothetical protein
MKKALISPNVSPIEHIASWTQTAPYKPTYIAYPNSCRVADVCDAQFEVASPLFWVDCNDNVLADQFYFDTITNEILPIVNAVMPV